MYSRNQRTNANVEYIRLRIVDKQNFMEMRIRLRCDAKFAKMRKTYAERCGVNVWSLKFVYGDSVITDEHTPRLLEMENNDLIEVYGMPFLSALAYDEQYFDC